ncbi:MAG: SLBB domain-containing protein [Gemmatimonadaceae bacterium]|nr:SLBB domain-containing protein [Gemmatimonadaceae bacterium]
MMNSFYRNSLVGIALLSVGSSAAFAQTPTAADAQRILQSDPSALQRLRQELTTSGLTPDQVRARLREQGYPESLLDAYLSGGNASMGDSVGMGTDPFGALGSLTLSDSGDLGARCGPDPEGITPADSTTILNSGSTNSDSINAARSRALAARVQARNRCLARADSARRASRGNVDSLRRQSAIDSGFVIFGLETFRNATSQFDPNLNGPVDPNYRLGPGDKLVLILTGDVSASYTLDVTREGFVVIPQVGQLFVNNITLGQLDDILYRRLGQVYSGVRRGAGATTHFSVTPARIRTNQIFVLGDVMEPGSHRVSAAGTILSALYSAGGPTENGSMRQIQVKRSGRVVETLDVYDYLLRGDASHDARLQTGDIVFVPPHLARARIVGQIVRPATYEMKTGETLADLIQYAGGFTPTASRSRVQIERILPPDARLAGRDRIVTEVASPLFATGYGPPEPIRAGDVVRVFEVTSRIRNRISVRGDVWQPGLIGLSSGMTIRDAVRMAGGLKPDAYLGQILVTRLRPDSSRLQLRAAFTDTTGNVRGDFALQEDDDIQIFPKSMFTTQRYVEINGAVRRKGRVPYREGMTMRDLVLLAGGLDQSADLSQAEIARLPEDRRAGATAVQFRTPLDSSYIFERGPDGRYFGPPGLPGPIGPAPEVTLKPYDNILIFRQPNWELQRTVILSGEVRLPGRYSLLTKSEKLSDLIKRAGGLTPEAYADGITFYRTKGSVGRIGVDLPQVLDNSRSRDNLLLQDGDSVSIPRFSAVVNVTGAVNSPIAVTYVPGRTIDYYIRAAGGSARNGATKYAYVTQPNGKVEAGQTRFLIPYRPKPRPGSTIFVPEKDPNDKPFDLLSTAGSIAQVLASFLAISIALRR